LKKLLVNSSVQEKLSKEWLYEFQLDEVIRRGCSRHSRGRRYLNVAGHEAVSKNRADVSAGSRMHELSIAMSMIDAVLEQRERCGGSVDAIHLRLGPLSGVDRAALEFAYEIAREQTPLAETRLVITETAIEFHCAECNCVRNPVSLQRMACSACGAPAGEITAGRELEIVAIEVMENEPATTG
jgi:hydrogenase nickel incorporation protein HypA/HybF